MLLKDCPVGSVVRLVSLCGNKVWIDNWHGVFCVKKGKKGVYVTDKDGEDRHCVQYDPDYQFEIVNPAPHPRITFTVGGQEFYVGQRVWSLAAVQDFYTVLNEGDELEIRAQIPCGDTIICSKSGEARGIFFDLTQFSTTPPDPHEWKRGDWARHEEKGVVFITGQKSYNDCAMFVTDDKGVGHHISSSELTFISHSEPPK